MKARIWAISLTVLAGSLWTSLTRAEDIALVGGDVYTVSGAMLPGATVLIRGDKIAAVGRDLAVPKGARTIDCQGKRVTPGLIETNTALGLVEISLVRSSVDSRPSVPDPIRAALDARDAINPRSTLVGVARRHGVTSVVTGPKGGLVAGRSAWFDLAEPTRSSDDVISGPNALWVNLGERGAGAVGQSRLVAFERLTEVFDDVEYFRRYRSAFLRNAMYKASTSRRDLEALMDPEAGRMPIIVHVSQASEIRAVVAWAKAERLKIALAGAEEAWLVADDVAAADIPVILRPLSNLPVQFDARHARHDSAALLARAGVRVAISTESSHNVSGLRFMLGNAVRSGLSHELALRAATLTPAEIFGAERTHGSIDRGKVANVVVWTADPFEPSSYAETVIIRGEIQSTESRQTRLANKYIRRLGLAPKARR